MPESSFKSPGVRTFEIDKSQPRESTSGPVGVPAGIVGTSKEGKAFVPVTVRDFSEFETKFGFLDGTQFGPVAASEWLKNASALTYVRVLGTGDGKRRSTSTGIVTNAGFVAGQQLPMNSGHLANNPHANVGDFSPLGRTYFLGAFMSQSEGSTMFQDAGYGSLQNLPNTGSMPIIRGVLFAASGVALRLSCSNGVAENIPLAASTGAVGAATAIGFITGTINTVGASPRFTMLNVGHKGDDFPRAITASLNPNDVDYFANIFNKDPEAVEDHGYVLYSHYDVYPEFAVTTGSGLLPAGPLYINGDKATSDQPGLAEGTYLGSSEAVFLLTGSQTRNNSASDAPNYENFQERYRAARTPFIVSQKFGGSSKDLFRVHLLSDGVLKGKASDTVGSNTKYKISIENVAKSSDANDTFGTFDLILRDYYDNDENVFAYESHRGLNLDPTSPNYIGRRIGDLHTFYDFDQAVGSQRLVTQGKYANVSSRIRVEITDAVDKEEVDNAALPVGFRGLDHLITSGTNALTTIRAYADQPTPVSGSIRALPRLLKSALQPPVPLREHLKTGLTPKITPNRLLYWGVQFTKKTLVDQPNKGGAPEPTIANLTKFFPDHILGGFNALTGSNAGQADEGGTILDCDRFNNNGFTLENLRVGTGSNGLAVTDDTSLINSWSYARTGNVTTDEAAKTRAFSVDDTAVPAVRRLTKFTMPFQQGFNGLNIFDKNAAAMDNKAAKGEMDDTDRGETSGPTVAAYRKAVDIIGEKSDADIQLLAIPGIRHSSVTDHAISTTENRFDALYIMDIEERDNLDNVVTSSIQNVDVSKTVSSFNDRSLDSSFAAAFFPNLNMDVQTKTFNNQTKTIEASEATIQVPPSVGVIGALSFNDAVAFPWFAPAGFARGALNAQSTAVSLNSTNMDDLYDKDINPIVSFPNSSGPVVFGQKTLQSAASALDRINVRRLLIDVRRSVKQVADQLIFEPNREATLQRFSALVTPILQRVQQNQGVSRFRVVIDSSTTTQADIENNTIRGKIFLQPTRTAEFISLDFVVTNAGVNGL